MDLYDVALLFSIAAIILNIITFFLNRKQGLAFFRYLKCVNQNHVEIDVVIQESGVFVTEPFAVKEDLTVVEKADGD